LLLRWRTGPPLAPQDAQAAPPAMAVDRESLETRAISFGVVVSFFSYSLYSIAGFDSVCCSVFLYLLLGATAVYFEPQVGEPARNIWVNIRRQWAAFRGRDRALVPNAPPIGLCIVSAILVGGLLVYSVWGAIAVMSAERAFVGDLTHGRDYAQKLEDIKRAIHINPVEGFYKQNLGTAYCDGARQLRSQAARLQQAGRMNEAQQLAAEAESYSHKGEVALYAALDHAWAPENAFISLFQCYYAWHKVRDAEYALSRGLEHSPHLGAVRANLAVLELDRGGYSEALKDAEWVNEVDPANETALRTACRSLFFLNRLDEAQTFCDRALQLAPKDAVLRGYIDDLQRARAKTASTAAVPNPP
jgi:hypothetical protein